MQCNVLQWQAFPTCQYFYIDHASPRQRTGGKHAEEHTQSRRRALALPCNTYKPHCGRPETPASQSSQTAPLLTDMVMQAPLEAPDFLVGRGDFSPVQDCITEFLY